MELKLFGFVNEVIDYMNDITEELEVASNDIKVFMKEILELSNDGYLNINRRVKSVDSLKEKILRANYYKKYDSSKECISNLSDLIGIRIECRFIEDEQRIYTMLKRCFSMYHSDGYYYNSLNENIRLELDSQQPQVQKNGFQIYRIDGKYAYNDKLFNFELQIKSLVNVFWGEIEHKIIYKNNNYTIWDGFFKDIMGSINKNLSMIDKQLHIIDDQFKQLNTINPAVRKNQIETTLAKMIYDIFSSKIKNSIGFIVDFRKSCNTIMKYIFRSNHAENLDDYKSTLVKTFSRLNDISENEIDFTDEIIFEREIRFEDEFSKVMGETIISNINSDFQWNIFFRILFEIELGNNAEDFETFIGFIKGRFSKNRSLSKLYLLFNNSEADDIVDDLMRVIVYSFQRIDSINFIYDTNIEEINYTLNYIVNLICKNIETYNDWLDRKDLYIEYFEVRILAIFEHKIEIKQVNKFLEKAKEKSNVIEISEDILEYANKLVNLSEIEADQALKLFKLPSTF
jgi:ppGpp synthetase/RelA/SpoT-type nucleotidyltranferase